VSRGRNIARRVTNRGLDAPDLHAWHDFFLLAGGASATLMGLVFVSVSLTMNVGPLTEGDDARREVGLFVTPIVYQFGYALAISGVAVAPWTDPMWFGWFSLIAGALAMLQNLRLLRGMWTRHRSGDRVLVKYWLLNAILPALAALVMCGSGALMVATGRPHPELTALVTLSLVLLGVSNAWRLVIFILGQARKRPR
jgi:hypothetical protein